MAELSESVGSYDRVRQQDQLAIQKLKVTIYSLVWFIFCANCCRCSKILSILHHVTFQDHIAHLSTSPTPVVEKQEKDEASVELDSASSVQNILRNISQLKEQLILTNRLSEKPIDIEGTSSLCSTFILSC